MIKPAFSIKNDLYPVIKLAAPLALTGIIQSSAFFFETVFFAHVSKEVLAAGALVTWLFGVLATLGFGTLSSINVLISHKYGAKDHDGISHVVRDGLLLALLLTIPAVLLFWNIAPIFLFFGQNHSVVLLAQSYLHALTWGILPFFIMFALLDFIVGLGHAKTIMVFNIISGILIIFFSFVLIFGKFSMPTLGIAGAGWGMTISYWIIVITLVAYILMNKDYKIYFRHIFNFSKASYLPKLVRVGFPMGAMYCVEVSFFFTLSLLMGSLSSEFLAANQIALQYMGTIMEIAFRTATAVTVRMGHFLGENKIAAAARAGYAGVFISLFIMMLFAICYWLFPSILISIDFDIHNPHNDKIIRTIEQLFAISALFQILEAVRISFFGALRALSDTTFTLITSIISFWCIAFPIGYWLAIPLRLGGQGLWWGMVMGAGVGASLLFWRYTIKIQDCYKIQN